jgi:hypothetical protein
MKALQSFLFLFLVLVAPVTSALEGWRVSNEGDIRLYVPNDLKKGKVFMYVTYGPFDLGGAELKSWFSNKARQLQNSLGKPLKEWVVKPDKGNWSISNQYVDKKSGKRLSVGYQGGMLDRQRAYIIAMLSSEDFMLLLKYGLAFDKVLNDAKRYLVARPSVTTSQVAAAKPVKKKQKKPKPSAQNKRKKIRELIRVAPGKGADLDDIELVWVYSRIDVIWGGIDVDTHLLFEDGTAYKDCVIPPDELDIEVSKRLEPHKWTQWRKHWGTYQMKNKKKDVWYDLKGGPGEKAPEGAELSGHFLSAGGSQYSGSWKRHIIFHDNGRFELSSFALQSNSSMGGGDTAPLLTTVHSSDKTGSSGATSVIGANVGGGTSTERKDGSKNTGTYEVNDYTITMLHDNGWRHTELFLFEKRKNKKNIVYRDDLYWLDD